MKLTVLGIVEAVLAALVAVWVATVFFGGSSGRGLAARYEAFEAAPRLLLRGLGAEFASPVSRPRRGGMMGR